MAGDDDHHPVAHVHRSHGSRSRGSVGAASPRRTRGSGGGESREGGGGSGGSSSGHRSHRHHAHSFSMHSRNAAAYSRSRSTSSDEDFWPHRTSPTGSSIDSSSGNTNIHHHHPSSSGGYISSSSRSANAAHTSLRLAFQSRGGGGPGRGERADAVGEQSAHGWGGGRGGDNNNNHGGRRSSLFLSLVDSEGSSRSSRSIEHSSEAPEPSSFGAMLPGVEVARRRRVRLAETFEAGGGFAGGHHEAGQSSRSSSRSGVTVAHHHHYHHHHHHHHVHHQAARHPSRPGTPRPGSLVRRMQDILQEHRARSPFQHITTSSSSSSSSSGGSTDRTNPVEISNSAPQSSSSHHHRSSRSHGQRLGEGEARIAPLSSLWRRQTSESSSNLRGAALEARNRLDERLRAAARSNHSLSNWQAVQSSYDMNLLFSDDDEDNFWSDDDGGETSLNEWLAVWAPTAWAPTSVEERWSRGESSGSSRASSSRNPTFKPRPSEGLSKAAISALPRQVVGSTRGTAQAAGGSSSIRNSSKMEQEDCPVCLEGFLQGQSLMTLPCNHRFHPDCLTPWLTNHGQCPYCRADIVKDIDTSSEQKNSSRLMGGSDEELLSWVEAIERDMDRLSYS